MLNTTQPVRLDIQLLRALAIVLVLADHADVPVLRGGFLGVDIFFVISGYLMTAIILRDLDEHRFGFGAFYARRVRRLLPAAYAMLLVTTAAAMALLDGGAFREYLAQLAASFAFVANIILWLQSDYFGSAAVFKPLLHMWSLAIEEQYYLLLPLFLFLCPRRGRLAAIAGMMLASLALCLWTMTMAPSAAFYFLPMRAWELGFGSVIAALIAHGHVQPRPMPLVRLLCLTMLIVIPFTTDENRHPGIMALLVCAATMLLLVPGYTLRAHPLLKGMRKIGDRSYSQYLVHWPVFSLAAHVYFGEVPATVRGMLVVLCLIWAELQYRFVERRFRKVAINARSLAALVLIPLCTVGVAYGWSRAAPASAVAPRLNTGLDPVCSQVGNFIPYAQCRTSAQPTILIWGDSFAMHIVDGLAQTSPRGVEQATRPICGPFLGLAPINGRYKRAWADQCIGFNDDVLAYLARSPHIDTVVLSSALRHYIPGVEDKGWRVLERTGRGMVIVPQDNRRLIAGMRRTVNAIRAMNKRVILFAPPPLAGFDVRQCDERKNAGLLVMGTHADCAITTADYRHFSRLTLDVLDTIRAQRIVPVIAMANMLCKDSLCRTRIGNVPLYGVPEHLSPAGSAALGKAMNWGAMVERDAR